MNEFTRKRINKTVFNYLSIVGLWKGQILDHNNPIIYYFLTNITVNKSKVLLGNIFSTTDTKIENLNDILNISIPNAFFHLMIKEFYNVYNQIDNILENQNEEVREILISFVGNEYEFNNYVNNIVNEYKDSFYELVRYYKSDNIEFNKIKIELLRNKMDEFVAIEEYEKAAELRDKINDITEKGK